MSATYPKRAKQFFANKFLRLAMKAVAAQEVGPEGLALLTAIVMTEDAKQYSGPVTFFNSPLMGVCGFTSEKVFFRVRERCVARGWLHYEQGKRGVAARYWVTIPEQFAGVQDGPVDEDASEYASGSGSNVGNNRESIGNQLGGNRGVNREPIGGPFIPTPTPTPKPKDSCSEPDKPASEPASDNEPIAFPVFPVVGGTRRWHLPAEMVVNLAESYPNVDLPAECRKAWAWAMTNGSRRKTAGGMPAFLNNWMSREQNKPRAGPVVSGRQTVAEHNKPAVDRVREKIRERERQRAAVGGGGEDGSDCSFPRIAGPESER